MYVHTYVANVQLEVVLLVYVQPLVLWWETGVYAAVAWVNHLFPSN